MYNLFYFGIRFSNQLVTDTKISVSCFDDKHFFKKYSQSKTSNFKLLDFEVLKKYLYSKQILE